MAQAGKVHVCIYDLKGAVIQSAELYVQEGRNSIILPQQNTGMYLVSIKGNGIYRYEGGKFKKIFSDTCGLWIPSGNTAVGIFDGNLLGKESIACSYISSGVNYFNVAYEKMLSEDHMVFDIPNEEMRIHSIIGSLYHELWQSTSAPDTIKNMINEYFYYPYVVAVSSEESIKTYECIEEMTTMTEPRIYAVLAAPPFFEGYEYEDSPSTSWGKTSSQATGGGFASSNIASLILGFEQDITIFGHKIGGVDFETHIGYDYTFSDEEEITTEYGIEYTTFTQDAVVLQFTPFTTYTYKCTRSDNPDELDGLFTISLPDKPRNMVLSMDDYVLLRADNPNIPDLRKVFTHTMGNPFTYPSSPDDFKPNYGKGGVLWANGDSSKMVDAGSGGKIALSITITEETTSTSEHSFELDVELVGNLAGIKAGFGYGNGETWSTSHTEGVGHSVTGEVLGPKQLGEVPNFRWNICKYNYKLNNQEFPVVNYMVTR